MKSAQLFVSILFLIVNSLFSQVLDLENVTLEQLNQKEHQIDKGVAAAILFKKANTKFKYSTENGYQCYTEFDVKIKIFKKEGISWANYQIPYYVGYNILGNDMVNVVKAYSYNIVDGTIVKERVSEVGQIEQSVNDSWKIMKVFFPNVKEGTILEIKYVLKSQNLGVLPDFQYQYDIPVDFAEYITEIPEFYLYKGMKNGNVPIEINESIEDGITAYTDKYDNSRGLVHRKIKTIYTVKDVPALVEEGFVSHNNNFGKIEHELQTIRRPNQKLQQISKTWTDVALSIYETKEFGSQIKKKSYYKDDLTNLIKEFDTEKVKMEKVFKFIQNRMRWNNRNSYMPKNSLEYIYKEKVGSAAEINLILISMLRASGLNANPVLLSTKDNGIALFPNSSKINYVIAAVDINSDRFILDATNKFCLPNLLPLNDLNWKGQLMKKDGECAEIDLMPKVISKMSTNLIGSLSSEGVLSGKIKKTYFDYHALSFREMIGKYSVESIASRLENDFKGVYIDDYKLENNYDLNKPIVEFYSFKKEGVSEFFGDKIYFAPLEFMEDNVNPFHQERRVSPIDFVFPSQKKKIITIDLPKGYSIDSMPATLSLMFKDNLLTYNFAIVAIGNQIQINSVFDINVSLIAPEDYEELKKFYAEVIKKQTEKIVLKKV
ncbi:DUF3857 domain-containing protein [Flavobacterium sp. H122]|uniref:DUF3857 domain-containing protein n=1 Tax=Flavobacterium sp. H122 TaxID=2529860 RepID=UPI0010AAF13C|nr:DUF3857 domain-containing protein [Flavobacterium sp. H122]